MSRRDRRDRGAVLVEFALVAPLLFLLIFGIVEFGNAYNQNLDVRHGARESARLVAVNFRNTAGSTGATQRNELFTEMCGRMDDPSGATITLQIPAQGSPIGATGQRVTVGVAQPLNQVTGVFSPMLDGKVLSSTVDIRIEQDATWTNSNSAVSQVCP